MHRRAVPSRSIRQLRRIDEGRRRLRTDLVDDEEVRLRDARSAFPGDLVTARNVNHVDDVVSKFARVVGCIISLGSSCCALGRPLRCPPCTFWIEMTLFRSYLTHQQGCPRPIPQTTSRTQSPPAAPPGRPCWPRYPPGSPREDSHRSR